MGVLELLAPSGDLERLKIACLYGADAVYIGGQNFSLRANALNFSLEDMEEAVKYAHSLGKKVYVTVNIVFHDKDLNGIENYLKELDRILEMIASSPEIEEELYYIEGNAEFEKEFQEKLMEEIKVEVKKDSDRIENAHKVFVALETGELDELLSDPETSRWAKEVYEKEKSKEEQGIGNN